MEDQLYKGTDYLDEEIYDPKQHRDIFPGSDGEGVLAAFNKKLISWIDEELNSGDFSGSRMAEVCSGPVLVTSIFCSRIFKELLLFDYPPQNRREITKWLNEEDDAFDWSSFVQDAAKLEHSTPKEIEKRTRSSIKQVCALDLTKANPMPGELLPFDFIYTAWTLESVAQTEEEYRALVSQCGSWLRPGGGMLLLGSFSQTFFSLESKRFHSLTLDEDLVRSALNDAGFEVKRVSYFAVDSGKLDLKSYSDRRCLFFMSAVKKN